VLFFGKLALHPASAQRVFPKLRQNRSFLKTDVTDAPGPFTVLADPAKDRVYNFWTVETDFERFPAQNAQFTHINPARFLLYKWVDAYPNVFHYCCNVCPSRQALLG
jgi:hypothetical protein